MAEDDYKLLLEPLVLVLGNLEPNGKERRNCSSHDGLFGADLMVRM